MVRHDSTARVRGTRRSFNYEWLRQDEFNFQPWSPSRKVDMVQIFLNDVGLDSSFLAGKIALDAGCGGGRFTYAMLLMGAEVVSVDLSDSAVTTTAKNLKQVPNVIKRVSLMQADLLRCPLRPNAFDFILAWGVLHHTIDTRKALESVARLLKPGGMIYLMIYEKQNILKELMNRTLRWFTTHIPPSLLFKLCSLPSLLGRSKFFSRLNLFLVLSPSRFENYDWYSCPYQHHHSEAEVVSWLRELRFDNIIFTHPPTAFSHRVPALHSKYGGVLHVRAQKIRVNNSE